MKILFRDLNTLLCEDITSECLSQGILDFVDIKNEKFEYISSVDAIVAAGNSFGVMSGGIDHVIKKMINAERLKTFPHKKGKLLSIQTIVKNKIEDEFFGELPVGSSMVVETETKNFPFIIYAPTMRVPLSLKNDNHNVFNASISSVTSILQWNKNNLGSKINSVLFCGMGTGTGFFPTDLTAKQMVFAFKKLLGLETSIKNLDTQIPISIDLGLMEEFLGDSY